MALHFSRRHLVRRACAYFLDGLIIASLWAGTIVVIALSLSDTSARAFGAWGSASARISVFYLLAPVLALAYCIAMEVTPWRATIGEKVCSLRVVSSVAVRPAFLQIFLRNVLKLVASIAIFMLTTWVFFWRLMNAATYGYGDSSNYDWIDASGLATWTYYAVLFVLGSAYLAVRFGPVSQVWHDRLAGTQLSLSREISSA